MLGPRGALTGKRPFTDATVPEIEAIHALGGDDVVFQIEIPVELVMVARMPRAVQPLVARLLARGVTALARRAPAGARFGVHLCLGDMNHHALGKLQDTAPLVTLANALARSWPADRPLEFLHAPFAAADVPPVTAPRWYAPLGRPVGLSHACGLGRRTPEDADRALARLAELAAAADRRRVPA